MATLGTYRCLLCLLCFLDRNCFCTHSKTHTVAVWPCWLRIWVMSCLHESSLYRVHTGKVKVALVSCLLFLSLCWQLCVDILVDSVGNLKILCFCFWTAKHVKKLWPSVLCLFPSTLRYLSHTAWKCSLGCSRASLDSCSRTVPVTVHHAKWHLQCLGQYLSKARADTMEGAMAGSAALTLIDMVILGKLFLDLCVLWEPDEKRRGSSACACLCV